VHSKADSVTRGKDFFVSYTGADQAWAEWIANTLEANGHTTILQAWDFRPGESFIERMDQALGEAERVLAVGSPAYFRSPYARREWAAALAQASGRPGRLLLVRIAPVELPPLLGDLIYLDLVGLDQRAASRALLSGVTPGRTKPTGQPPFPGVRFPGQPPAVFGVPPRNPNFTGRDDLLGTLRKSLTEIPTGGLVQASAVHGLGGVGKTQLAIEYAHRYAADYDLVWWIPAEQPLAIGSRLAVLARRLDLPERSSLEEQVALLFDELGQRKRWLLIYDNAEQPQHLDGYRPAAGVGHILITSRNPAWGAIATALPVDVLPRAEAVALLRRRTGMDALVANRFTQALGDLPLALEQAAAYLEATATSPGAYLDLLVTRARELFALSGQPGSTEQTIATTWTVSLDRLRKEAPNAEDLLRLCAFLAPDDLPRAVLEEHSEVLPRRLARAMRDQLGLQQALGGLRRYSLAAVTDQTISVHRLVQAVIRHELNDYQTREWAQAAVALMLAGLPGAGNVAAWPAAPQLLAHALAASGHAEQLDTAFEQNTILLTLAAAYLSGWGENAQAKALSERVLRMRLARLGPNHPETALSFNNLAIAMGALGELPAARDYHERALRIRQAQFGPNHPETLQSLNNLGLLLINLGDLSAAREYLERVLRIRQSQFGSDHLDTAGSHSNLSHVLHQLGDLPAAQRHAERAVAIFGARLGHDHLETAGSLGNLAGVLRELGDLPAARKHYERVLAIFEARVGLKHPNTAGALKVLADVLRELGELSAARDHYERAVAISEARLGPNHPDTAVIRQELATVRTALQGESNSEQSH
jgi:tetratricopeptide (TPR) repeat protein